MLYLLLKKGCDNVDIDYTLIGKRIKQARIKKKLSQEDLSELLNISVTYMSRIERGSSPINLKRLAQISNILNIPIEQLITGTVPYSEQYLDKDLYEILIKCTPEKQKLVYNIAKIVSGVSFV